MDQFSRHFETILISRLGHLRGSCVGYKYSSNWFISTMNLQVRKSSDRPFDISELKVV